MHDWAEYFFIIKSKLLGTIPCLEQLYISVRIHLTLEYSLASHYLPVWRYLH